MSENGTTPVGQCEGCGNELFEGDLGHSCTDGPILCEECSPSWGDIKEQWDEGRQEEDEGERAAFLEAYQAHINAGGSADDKAVYCL